MAKSNPGPARPTGIAAESDIYTVLLLVSSLSLLGAVIFVAVRATAAFGSFLPPGGV